MIIRPSGARYGNKMTDDKIEIRELVRASQKLFTPYNLSGRATKELDMTYRKCSNSINLRFNIPYFLK